MSDVANNAACPMRRTDLFPTLLYEFERDTANDSELFDELRQCTPVANAMFNLFDYTTPRISELRSWVEGCFTAVCDEHAPYYFDIITRAWVNTTRFGGWETPHVHGGSEIVAVYYLSTPNGCGNLHLIDPRPAPPFARIDERGQTGRASHIVPVRAGKLVIFPASIVHFVEANASDVPRVSIAINAKVQVLGKGT